MGIPFSVKMLPDSTYYVWISVCKYDVPWAFRGSPPWFTPDSFPTETRRKYMISLDKNHMVVYTTKYDFFL